MTNKSEKILQAITDYYLGSKDFNGISLIKLQAFIGISQKDLLTELIRLINEEKISVNFGDRHINPHIKAFDPEPKAEQIIKFDKCDFDHACAYPEKMHLKNVIDAHEYSNRPFTLRLALGDSQLSYLSFDLSVLEAYRNDPRYYYSSDDIYGWISISDSCRSTFKSLTIGVLTY